MIFINLDFADVRTIMSEMGMAMMGAAIAQGENRAVEAAQKAISSPLLEEVSIQGARGVLINITGGPDLSLHEVNEAATLIQEEADEEANIIFGAVIDESMGDEVRITVIATGFGEQPQAGEKPRPGPRDAPSAGGAPPLRAGPGGRSAAAGVGGGAAPGAPRGPGAGLGLAGGRPGRRSARGARMGSRARRPRRCPHRVFAGELLARID